MWAARSFPVTGAMVAIPPTSLARLFPLRRSRLRWTPPPGRKQRAFGPRLFAPDPFTSVRKISVGAHRPQLLSQANGELLSRAVVPTLPTTPITSVAWVREGANAESVVKHEGAGHVVPREYSQGAARAKFLPRQLQLKNLKFFLAPSAAELGANAVVGVSIDYEVVGEQGSMLMVVASGTAVRLAD